MVAEDRAQVAGQINGADQGPVDLARLEEADRGFQGADAGALLAGEGEARAADPELPGDPAGDDAAEGAHGPVGGQGRSGGVTQLRRSMPPVRRGVSSRPSSSAQSGGLLGERPAEAEVGGVQVEGDADEDPGVAGCPSRSRPASAMAAAAVWSIRSCWGSISSISRGGMRNWSAARATSSR